MLQTFIKPLPLIFTLATAAGVLLHDTQVDRATSAAIAMPAVAAVTYMAIDNATKTNEHIHVERAHAAHQKMTLRASLPRLQPRDDDRRYQLSKKLYFGGADNEYIWPSV
jgi:hypothetical protein